MTITVRGANEIAAALRTALPRIYPSISTQVGYALGHIMAKYPGKVRYPIQWTSRKQRRWYFAYRYEMEYGRAKARALRLGAKERMRRPSSFVPYRRGSDQTSQQLGGGWRVERRGQNAVLRNPVRYAAYVQGRKNQQPFHQNTGWINTQQGIEQLMRSRQLKDIFRRELRMVLGGLVK